MNKISETNFPNDSVTCVSPWETVRIDPYGGAKYCDSSRNSNFDVGDSYLEWWQKGEYIQSVRDSIRGGTPVPGCSRCYESERIDGVSFRSRRHFQSAIHHGKYFRISVEQAPAWKRLQKNTVDGLPAYVSVSFTNECNSRCIMCVPLCSNLVAEDHADFGFIDKPLTVHWMENDRSELKYQSILKMVLDNSRLLYLKLNGGEPFMSTASERFLKDIVDHGKKDFNFVVNTNGTVWNQIMVDCMLEYQTAMVDFGIETMDHTNDYIRFGSSLEEIESMIQRYRSYQNGRFQLVLHCVPQALSIFNLDSLIDYCSDNNDFLMGNPLFSPDYFAIPVLPLDMRKSLAYKWMEKYRISTQEIEQEIYHEKHTNFVDPGVESGPVLSFHLRDFVVKMIKNLFAPEPHDVESLRRKLISHVVLFDKKHGTDFLKTFPHLEELYRQYQP